MLFVFFYEIQFHITTLLSYFLSPPKNISNILSSDVIPNLHCNLNSLSTTLVYGYFWGVAGVDSYVRIGGTTSMFEFFGLIELSTDLQWK